MCGSWESTRHVLWGCSVAAEVGADTRIKLSSLAGQFLDFADIVWEIWKKNDEIDWPLFTTIAWSLWNNRNSVRHGRKRKQAKVIAQEVSRYVEEFRQESP